MEEESERGRWLKAVEMGDASTRVGLERILIPT